MATSSRRVLSGFAVMLSIGMSTVRAGAQSGFAGVKVESRVDASNVGVAVVTNLASVPLTAYLIDVVVEPCGPMQPRSTPRATDAVLSADSHPLGHLESSTVR